MPKKNVDIELKDLEGKTMTRMREDAKSEPLRMKHVMSTSLLAQHERDVENPTPEEKAERYLLAVKINTGGTIDLKTEQWAVVKRCVGISYGPIVVGQVFEFIEK